MQGSRVQIEQPPAAEMCFRATFDTGSFSVVLAAIYLK